MNEGSAIVLANGHYSTPFAKTSHGLVRGPCRYRVVGVVDPECAGGDAGELLDGVPRGIPVGESVDSFLAREDTRATHCVVGVATEGGLIPPGLRADLRSAAEAGLHLVNGLHELLADDPELVSLAAARGSSVLDLRKPRPLRELRFWTGEALSLEVARLAILGTDCAIGKRTTTMLLRAGLQALGLRAESVYTGQTGWLQGVRHGFILDATPNDFVSGELEGAVLACARESDPDVILIEGQSSLRNPSGPCGAELLLSAGARGVVLQHAPERVHFEGFESVPTRIPALAQELELIRLYGSEVWALTIHESAAGAGDGQALAREHGVPVLQPLRDDGAELAAVIARRLGFDA